MKSLLFSLAVLALCLAVTPDAEARCRGRLRARLQERRGHEGRRFHLFDGRHCEADANGQQSPELIRAPHEADDDGVRFAAVEE